MSAQPLGDLGIRRRTALDDASCRVINAARRIERAAQYGTKSASAHREFDLARADLLRMRYALAGGPS